MLLASIASVASILCLCCLWCTRSSAQQLARSRHSNTNVGFAVYTLHVHLACTSLVATDVRYVICGVNWAASLPSSLLRLPPSISPWARHSSTSQNPLQYLDLKTILASPEQEWPDQIIWTINLGLKASIHFQAAVVPNSSFVNSCCPQALLTDCEHLQTEACKRGFSVKRVVWFVPIAAEPTEASKHPNWGLSAVPYCWSANNSYHLNPSPGKQQRKTCSL